MTALLLRRPQTPDLAAEQAINDFQGETAEITGSPEPFKARSAVWTLAIMVVLFIAMASILKLDRVVSATGRVVSQEPTIVVQPLEISIIRSLNVRAGQTVRRGEVLATLDPTFSSADVAQLDRQVSKLTAEIARLNAEAEGVAFTAGSKDQDRVLQESIWQYRQAEYAAKLANFEQRMATLQATIKSNQTDAEHYRSRLKIVGEIEDMRRTLEKNQTGSRLNSLIASDTRVETERNLGLSENTIRTSRHDLEALRAEREVFIQQWRSTVLTDLSTRQVELERAREELAKAQKRRDLVELRAIEDAVVLEVGKYSVGSVVESAQPIYTLMPLNAKLEVEAEIAGIDQGFVKPGDEVQVKLDAYRFVEHGMAQGVVKSISEDSFTRREDQSQAQRPFFRAKIELTKVNLRDVPSDFRLVPGMPLTADIVVGKRTIMAYLVEGALRNGSEGMREP
ncbi:HlyD family type I secretion periplasmic adaptor subunit [Azospirillum formosense]|uniref:Membrane fusion protein (MFP) family protein n=1 Tax=Azospirillum formosense TaxID=861533 RepID=A0ABX2KV77_9PROT|nr:HlyD family type I secretion periplasmic adaptor subunit [Azospirillum formosense]MBY3757556.1 HlyD family type I secretion periplasmic adaptor subunit [Azospirillum formosense]MBY3757682.1 HlyD family type I secretion periplasmic adaptor subunit [Azospirillum formosense]NUB19533.1 HlyD family type I secretion periplasmic adaptor subunit [Azospirillum formosense]